MQPLKTAYKSLAFAGPMEHEMATIRGGKMAEPRKLEMTHHTILDNDTSVTSMLIFHPYEPLILVANDFDGVSAFNFKEAVRWRGRGHVE